MRSTCKYLVVKECADIHIMVNTKFLVCEQVSITKCEILKENLKCFKELKILKIQ